MKRLNSDAISKRGGSRKGAGRKPNPAKDIRTGAVTAARLLRDLEEEKQIKTLYSTCGDARTKLYILFRLREWAYGKAAQPSEDKIIFDPNAPLKVIVEHIGSKNPAAAQAK